MFLGLQDPRVVFLLICFTTHLDPGRPAFPSSSRRTISKVVENRVLLGPSSGLQRTNIVILAAVSGVVKVFWGPWLLFQGSKFLAHGQEGTWHRISAADLERWTQRPSMSLGVCPTTCISFILTMFWPWSGFLLHKCSTGQAAPGPSPGLPQDPLDLTDHIRRHPTLRTQVIVEKVGDTNTKSPLWLSCPRSMWDCHMVSDPWT